MRLDLDGHGGIVADGSGDVVAAEVDLAEATDAWKETETKSRNRATRLARTFFSLLTLVAYL